MTCAFVFEQLSSALLDPGSRLCYMEDVAERRKRLRLMRAEASAATTSEQGMVLASESLPSISGPPLLTLNTPTGASLGPLQAVLQWQTH